MLHWDAASRHTVAYDGREKAPLAADEYLFQNVAGEPMRWRDAVVGGRSVGTPGVIAMLKLAHDRHGKLPWAELFYPAIKLAEQGFAVSPRLHNLIAANQQYGLGKYFASRAYFFTATNEPLPVGHILKNLAFAATLRLIARDGPSAFYRGQIAQDIVAAVKSATDNPGLLSLRDLADYRAIERAAVCSPYRQYTVCGMPPPTSGGITTLQILTMLQEFDLKSMKPFSAQAVHLYSQAARLAYADRNAYLADADFVEVPVPRLLDPAYLKRRARMIDLNRDAVDVKAGQLTLARMPGLAPELPSTTHMAVVDDDGNAVSMTSSIENAFGSTLMAGGFLLNNQLTDFSFRHENNDAPIANRVQPGKRPRSSMAPTLVFDRNQELYLVIGSPGGSRIINYVATTLLAILEWDMDIQTAIEMPRFSNRNAVTELEAGTAAAQLASQLEQMGHVVNVRVLTSGLHGIMVAADGLYGGADPRREGLALGN